MAVKSTGLRAAVLFAGVLACSIAGAQQVTITRDSKLLAEPNASAALVVELKQGATAEVTAKKGAWVQVKSAEGTGWTFGFNVSYGGSAPAAAAPTPQRRGTTATIGIRGLEKEDLKNATFDGKQLDALDAFAGGADDGDKGGSRKK
jgi:uncharacterized protein YraI